MGSLLEQYDLLSRLLLQAFINSLWQGALIVAIVVVLFRLAGRISATTRHAVWLVGLLTIAALPFLPASTQKFTMTIPPAQASAPSRLTASGQGLSAVLAGVTALAEGERQAVVKTKAPRAATMAEATLPEAVTEMAVTEPAPMHGAATHIHEPNALQLWSAKLFGGSAPMVLVAMWMMVCMLMLGRIASSYFSLARVRCGLHRLPEFQRRRMSRLATIFGLKRRVRIRTSSKVAMPMTIGVARPLIIVPEGLMEELSTAEFESVIAHELAHIKRCDYLTNLWQRVIQAFLFFHPAVWLIGNQLAVERELACDDWAVKLTGEPHRYASCLTRLAEILRERRMPSLAASIIFGKHVVSRRIEMILNTNRNATTSVSKPAMLYAMSVAVLFVCAYSFLSPVIAVPLAQSQAPVARRQETSPTTPAPVAVPQIVIVNGQQIITPKIAPQVATVVTPEQVAAIRLWDDDDDVVPMTVVTAAADEPLAEPDAAPVIVPLVYRNQAPVVAPAAWTQRPTPPAQPMEPPPAGGWGSGSGIGMGSGFGGQMPPRTANGDKAEPPAIPEAELIAVLSDIVRRDTDANVRSEALQGIYRLRTDASINALIQLYDAVSDVKVKGDILSNLMRRNRENATTKYDNSKAIAKIAAVAKTEKDENLRSRALNTLMNIKGDEGADHLIGVYDSLQDPKMKASVIRALAMNKSKKAIDKLIQIAKNDSDPTVRQYAVHAITNIDEGRLYVDLLDKARPGTTFKEEHFFNEQFNETTSEKVAEKQKEKTTTPAPSNKSGQHRSSNLATTPAPKTR